MTKAPIDEVELDELWRLCIEAAAAAGELVTDLQRRGEVDVTGTKSTVTDIVTNADGASEQLLRTLLLDARPGDGWLGEETGTTVADPARSQVRWIVDPIDGTVNYLYGLPGWAVSIAAEVGGIVVAGAVVVPTFGEVFAARLGGGAWHGSDRMVVSDCDELKKALVATGFSYNASVRTRQGNAVGKLLPLVRDIRRLGAASVDLCSVAAGRVDAYFEHALQPWDRAAGTLIAQEAGAVVLVDDDGSVVVAGPALIDELAHTLAKLGS
jgi:myo-inositol-1(or 4)-monophosphatase